MTTTSCYFCGHVLTSDDEHCLNRRCARPQFLRDRFRIMRVVGEGGYGMVFEVRDELFDVQRAIKRIAASSFAAQQQNQSEANILARHARRLHFMPEIYDIWHEDTDTYLVMEYIEGQTLAQSLKRDGPWLPVGVEQFLRTMLTYLVELNRAGLTHRDLKPDNIIQKPDGTYVLLDFGISKQGDATQTAVRGAYSRFFASPEQEQGQPTDIRSDLYGLGATAYCLLTGGSYIEDSDDRLRLGVPLHPPSFYDIDVPDALESTIMQMLELDPTDRPQHPEDVLVSLEEMPGLRPRIGPKNALQLRELTRISGTTLLTKAQWYYHIRELAFSPNGRSLLILYDTQIDLWDIPRRVRVATAKVDRTHTPTYSWSTSGEQLAITLTNERATLWNAAGNVDAWQELTETSVRTFVWCPDDQLLMVVMHDGCVYLWYPLAGNQWRLLPNCIVKTTKSSGVWSPDAQLLATVTHDNTIVFWNRAGEAICSIDPMSRVIAMRWTDQNPSQLYAFLEKELCIWNTAGVLQQTTSLSDPDALELLWYIFHGHHDRESDVIDGVDNNTVFENLEVLSEDDAQITLGLEKGMVYCTISVPEAPQNYVWNANHTSLALMFSDGMIRLWQQSSTTNVHSWGADSQVLIVSTGIHATVVASPEADHNCPSSHTNLIRVDGSLMYALPDTLEEYQIFWSPDRQQFAFSDWAGLQAGTVGICRADGTSAIIEDCGELFDASWTPDNRNLLLEQGASYTSLWTANGVPIGWTDNDSAHGAYVCSTDGMLVARVHRDTREAELIRIDGSWRCMLPGRIDEDAIDTRRGIAWNQHNQLVAVGLTNGELKLWNTSGSLSHALVDHHDAIEDVRWSPDGRILETFSVDGKAHIWMLEATPRRILALNHPSQFWSPSWHLLAVISDDNTINVYARNGILLDTIPIDEVPEPTIVWSPNEQMFVILGKNGRAMIWNVNGKLRGIIEIAGVLVQRIGWSPDGRIIVSQHSDEKVIIRDASGRMLTHLPNWPTWSFDGRFIGLTVDGILRIWGV